MIVPKLSVVINEATDKLGLSTQRQRNKIARETLADIGTAWRAQYYAQRFDPEVVYRRPFSYQWGISRRAGRYAMDREIPIKYRTPLWERGIHAKLYMTGKVTATATKGKTLVSVALPFGHPVPNRVKGSPFIRELQKVATFVTADEMVAVARWAEMRIATGKIKYRRNRPRRPLGAKRRRRT